MPRSKTVVPGRARAQEGPQGREGQLQRPQQALQDRAPDAAARGPVRLRAPPAARSATSARLWITRINAAARLNGLSYSTLIAGLEEASVDVNRKLLADLAVRDAAAFAKLAEVAKSA